MSAVQYIENAAQSTGIIQSFKQDIINLGMNDREHEDSVTEGKYRGKYAQILEYFYDSYIENTGYLTYTLDSFCNSQHV